MLTLYLPASTHKYSKFQTATSPVWLITYSEGNFD